MTTLKKTAQVVIAGAIAIASLQAQAASESGNRYIDQMTRGGQAATRPPLRITISST